MSDLSLCIGLDAGGTKTALLAAGPDGQDRLELTGPTAQVQRVGSERAAVVLADLIREALERRPDARLGAVCAGLSGAGRAADQEAVAEALRRHLAPLAPAHLQIVHDGVIALAGAFDGGSGILVIAGTGSIALARPDEGPMLRAGGWGYLLGDEASGYDLGRHALMAVAAALDGGPATRLRALVADRFGLDAADALIARVYQDKWPFQEAAPLLLEAARDGDAVARALLADRTDRLARQISWLAGRAGAMSPRIALVGGLSNNAAFHDALADALARHLPGWTLQPPLHDPVEGAWQMALRDFGF